MKKGAGLSKQARQSNEPRRGNEPIVGGAPETVAVMVDEEALVSELRELVLAARQRIATVANATTLLYWNIGSRLLTATLQDGRAAYGKQVVATVSRDLTAEFGQSFSVRGLYRAMQFCQRFPDQEIVSTLSTQLSWSHFMELLPVEDPLARDFYAEMCRVERWDVRTLRQKVGGVRYQRTAFSKKPQGEGAAQSVPSETRRKQLHARGREPDNRLVQIVTVIEGKQDGRKFVYRQGLKGELDTSEIDPILDAATWRDETCAPVIAKDLGARGVADPLHGRFSATVNGKRTVVEYTHDAELRDTEQVPLLEEGGIAGFLVREVLPYAPDAWFNPASVKVGYEISFNRHFYAPPVMRTLEEIGRDILAIEKEAEGLLDGLLKGSTSNDG